MMIRSIVISILFSCSVLFAQNKSQLKIEISGDAKTAGEFNKVLITKTGTVQYTIEKSVPYDFPFPNAKLFDDGSMVISDAFDASLEFYNSSGRKTKKYNFYKEPDAKYERALFIQTSGNTVAAVLCEPGKSSRVTLLDADGNEFQSYEIVEEMITGLAVNERLGLTAISAQQWTDEKLLNSTKLINFDGQTLGVFEISFDKGEFVNENELLVFNKKSLHLIDINSKSILTSLEVNDRIILDCKKVNDEIFAASGRNLSLENGKWIYEDLLYEKYSRAGSLIDSKSFNNLFFESAEVIIDSGKLRILTDDKEVAIN